MSQFSEQQEKARALEVVAGFMKLTDEERVAYIIERDKHVRVLQFNMKTQADAHKLEMLQQARGKKVDAVTALTFRRLERDHAHHEGRHAAFAALVARVRGNLPKELKAEAEALLAVAPPKPTPTPGKELMAFQPTATKLTARDLVLAIEDEMKAKCPEALRLVIEYAVANE